MDTSANQVPVGKGCIVYARVSTEDQVRKGFSLADQVELCLRRAREMGYPAERVILLKDEGLSGDAVDRPGLNRLRELVAEPGAVGHVIIYDPDRFARNLSLQLILTEEIVKGGAVLEFINFEWKNTPEGKLFYSLRGAIAEYEKAKIKERTRRGREQKAKQGLMPVGKSLYGYKFNPETDKLEPVESEQAVLRVIRDLVLNGAPGEDRPLSCVKAAQWLAQHGIPAPKGNKWYPSTITKMLRNEAYTGTYWVFKTDSTSGKRLNRPREQQYPIAILPVWDEATRQALIKQLEANLWLKRGRRSQGNYLLKGLVYCGVCADGVIQMRGNSVVDKRRNYQYYICYKNHGRVVFDTETGLKIKCPSRHWPAPALDKAVWNKVREAVRNPGQMLGQYNNALRSPEELERLKNELAGLRNSAQQKQAECDRYLRLFAMGHIKTEAKLEEMVGPARAELEALKARLAEVEALLAGAEEEHLNQEAHLLTLEQVRRRIDAISDDDFEAKRDIIVRLVKRVIVGSDGVRIIGHLNVPLNDAGQDGEVAVEAGSGSAGACHAKGSAVG